MCCAHGTVDCLPVPSRADCWPLGRPQRSLPWGNRAMKPGLPWWSPGCVCVDTTWPRFESCQPHGSSGVLPAAPERVRSAPSVPHGNRLSTDGRHRSAKGNGVWRPVRESTRCCRINPVKPRRSSESRTRTNPRRRSPVTLEPPRASTDGTSVDQADGVSPPWGVVLRKVMVTLDPARRLASKASIQ
jgi:hypothetical protein